MKPHYLQIMYNADATFVVLKNSSVNANTVHLQI